jgi:hypothetical protein
MTITTTSRPITLEVSERMFDQMAALADQWVEQGFCPHCVARGLLMHAGVIATVELEPDDMSDALGYIAKQSAKHGPAPDGSARH